jgi:excisionase family DNA binding protein
MSSELDIASVPRNRIAAVIAALAARLLAEPEESAAPASPTSEPEKMLTVEEVAERLRCSTKKIYRLAPKVQWARKVGAGWLFSRNGLENWLTRQKP